MSVDLSIIVPYRNRQLEVVETIRTILKAPVENLECIVSDNDDEPLTELSKLANLDNRLRIVRPPSLLNMTDNFEFATQFARGDWLVFMGSDDGLIWSRVENLLNQLNSSRKGVVTAPTVDYFWPGAYAILRRDPSMRVTQPRLSWWVDRRSALTAPVCFPTATDSESRHRPMESLVPKIYGAGAIRSDVVRKIRDVAGGRLFRTIIPDWFLSLAAFQIVGEFEFFDEAAVIQGASTFSNGLRAAATGFTSDEKEQIAESTEYGMRALLDVPNLSGTAHHLSLWLAANQNLDLVSAEDRQKVLPWIEQQIHEWDEPTCEIVCTLFPEVRHPTSGSKANARGRLSRWDRGLQVYHQLGRLAGGAKYYRCTGGPIGNVFEASCAIAAYDSAASMQQSRTIPFRPLPVRRWHAGQWRGIEVSM